MENFIGNGVSENNEQQSEHHDKVRNAINVVTDH